MKAFFSALLICVSLGLYSQPQIKFEEKKIKFEEVDAGQTLSFDFFFVNKGDEPLLINDIKVECTCTKFTFPKEPIMPNKGDTIHVTFDTKGKTGWQYRTLEIISNSKNSPDKVQFIGKVVE